MEISTHKMHTKTSLSADSEEKQTIYSCPVNPSPTTFPSLAPEHAVEYIEFLGLKRHFEDNPKEYKRIVRGLKDYPYVIHLLHSQFARYKGAKAIKGDKEIGVSRSLGKDNP
ncbi:hypothetical protein HYALB_00011059 [Hymenoscyphus albidus]|uniref:Uncharacterized protein n=1 Tax=Hymenoscyphus albidus TaxID=595503 RepID=A0A9N9Q898_9HELO|nr:hypothetical protein HYALB_00011059 [Hymenoscyphus albidus]